MSLPSWAWVQLLYCFCTQDFLAQWEQSLFYVVRLFSHDFLDIMIKVNLYSVILMPDQLPNQEKFPYGHFMDTLPDGPSTVISKSLLCKGRNPQSQRVITGVYMHHVINKQVIQPWTINLDPLCFMKMMYSRFIADYPNCFPSRLKSGYAIMIWCYRYSWVRGMCVQSRICHLSGSCV